MAANTLQDLYVHKLRDLYSAEDQITKALPMMMEKAANPELRRGFALHLEQTREQRDKVEQLLQLLGEKAGKETCRGMEGIITENQKTMKMVDDQDALDAVLIAGAQAVEHYEITRYGSLIAYAQELGRQDCAGVLQQTLDEEKATDKKLTTIAESRVNRQAT